jgi:hypothetical protein
MSSLSEESLQFLAHEYTLWDKSFGDPQQSNSSEDSKKKFDGRFAPGQYIFPFSFPFPDAESKPAGPNTNSISPFPPLAVGSIRSPIASPTFPLHKYVEQNVEKMSWDRRVASSGGRSPPGVDQVFTQMQASEHSPSSASMPPRVYHSLASPLPQSFMEREVKSHVAYDLSVRIVHGRFRTSSKLGYRFSHAWFQKPEASL